jgi:lipid-A-disaccharide synthase
MPLKIMLSAAEVSGDVHGAALAQALKDLSKDVTLFGMGGEMMAAAGVDIKLDITDKSSIGISEAVKHIPSHIRSLRSLVDMMKAEKPDALILIDAQGFHMPLARKARKLGIRTIYYIAPQEWLWGTKRGLKKVTSTIDLIVAIFEKEYVAYKGAGGNVIYEGHPIIDIAKPSYTKAEFKMAAGVEGEAPFIGIFPGSRKQEIEKLLPLMLDALELIKGKMGKVNPILGLASSKFKAEVEKMVEEKKINISIIEGGTYDALSACDVSIAASGTILLEATALQAPVIMTYKLSPFSEFIAKFVFRINRRLPYYAMPNILANRKIIPEYVLEKAKPENLASEAVSLLADPEKIKLMKAGMKQLAGTLGKPGVVARVAKQILSFLSDNKKS